MQEQILNISQAEISSALEYGDKNGYILFPEIRDPHYINKIKDHPLASKMLAELVQYVDTLDAAKIPELQFKTFCEFSETGNRHDYESIYFESKKQLHAMIAVELLDGSSKFIETIQERLWKWCETYTWELPAHVPLSPVAIDKAGGVGANETVALFSAETAFYFSEILSLIRDRLHPLLTYRLNKEIDKRVLKPFKNRSHHWETLDNNWASVCAGAVGCTAIYIIKDLDELSSLIYRAIKAMECFLTGFDDDGVTPEGLSYWNYGFSFFVYFSELLKERTCGQIDLLKRNSKLQKIAELPLFLQFPDGHMINFSDANGFCWEGDVGLLCRLSDIFNIEDYRIPQNLSVFKDHTSKWAITSRNLFWSLKNDLSEKSIKTGMFFFPKYQWLIDRRMLTGSESAASITSLAAETFFAFAAKGGRNDESHNHNDLGHFILFYDGDMLFVDLGAPEYTKKYFSPERYNILHASSRGHSVPVINGHHQASGAGHAAQVLKHGDDNGIVHFGLNLTRAYDIKELSRFHRTFEWNYNKLTLNITDEFLFEKSGNNIQEAFVTIYEPVPAGEGKLLIKGNNNTATLSYDPAAKVNIIKEEFTSHHGETSAAYIIRLGYDTTASDLRTTVTIVLNR